MTTEKFFMDFLKENARMMAFISVATSELEAQGYEVAGVFDVPNVDENGNAHCGVDDILIGFEVTKADKTFNRFYGSMTHVFWDEREMLDWNASDEEIDVMHPLTTVSKKIEGAWVHIDSEKHPDHYKAILTAAKGLMLHGIIGYDRCQGAARRYILSVQTRCNEKGFRAPRMTTASLLR